jgi:hypothetical protein
MMAFPEKTEKSFFVMLFDDEILSVGGKNIKYFPIKFGKEERK